MPTRAENEILARGERQRAFAPDVRLFDGPSRQERAWDADYAQDDLLLGKTRIQKGERERGRGDGRYGRS